MNTQQMKKSQYASSLREAVYELNAMRQDPEDPQEVTLAEYAQQRWGISYETLMQDLGVNPNYDNIQNMVQLPDENFRWLVPEIIRDAIRVGLRTSPIYNALLAGEQSVKGLKVTSPFINMSDAQPLITGIGETIRFGEVSYGQKTVELRKFARGIKMPYEVRAFSSLSVVSIFLQDFGVKMGQMLDTMAIQTLINGDQADGSDATAVIGIQNPVTTTPPGAGEGLVYRDLLRPFIRMGRLRKNPTVMISGEEMALNILDLPEYKLRQTGTTDATLNVKTPIPTRADLYIHGAVPDNQVLILDPSQALLKFNAQALMVEGERIVSNQTEASYASFITGFGTIFQDSRIIVDQTEDFATDGFPPYFDPISQEVVPVRK